MVGAKMADEEHIIPQSSAVDDSSLVEEMTLKVRIRLNKLARFLAIPGRAFLALFAFSVFLVFCLHWLPPSTSALKRTIHRSMYLSESNGSSSKWSSWEELGL
jgi:hypothetical protein